MSDDIIIDTKDQTLVEYDITTDPDWVDYLKNCEEYDFIEPTNENKIWKQKIVSHRAINIDCGECKDEMIILGKIKKPETPKKKSFKFVLKNASVFCKNFLNDEQCNLKFCKYIHDFEKLDYCKGKCGRVFYENNFYSGNCSKRHSRETIQNYLFRKELKSILLKNVNFDLYEKPSIEFLETFIPLCKSLNIESAKIRIVKPRRTLEDFYRQKSIDESSSGYSSQYYLESSEYSSHDDEW